MATDYLIRYRIADPKGTLMLFKQTPVDNRFHFRPQAGRWKNMTSGGSLVFTIESKYLRDPEWFTFRSQSLEEILEELISIDVFVYQQLLKTI